MVVVVVLLLLLLPVVVGSTEKKAAFVDLIVVVKEIVTNRTTNERLSMSKREAHSDCLCRISSLLFYCSIGLLVHEGDSEVCRWISIPSPWRPRIFSFVCYF